MLPKLKLSDAPGPINIPVSTSVASTTSSLFTAANSTTQFGSGATWRLSTESFVPNRTRGRHIASMLSQLIPPFGLSHLEIAAEDEVR